MREYRSELFPVDPLDAIAAHLTWKRALRDAARSGAALNLDAAALDRPDRCELGLWLESDLACFEGAGRLRELHRGFHLLAGEMVRQLQASAPTEVVQSLERRLEELSTRMVALLGAHTALWPETRLRA